MIHLARFMLVCVIVVGYLIGSYAFWMARLKEWDEAIVAVISQAIMTLWAEHLNGDGEYNLVCETHSGCVSFFSKAAT